MVIAVVWIEMDREVAIVATLIMVLGMVYIAVCGNRMYLKFKIRKEEVRCVSALDGFFVIKRTHSPLVSIRSCTTLSAALRACR